jgi:hypothetical protein
MIRDKEGNPVWTLPRSPGLREPDSRWIGQHGELQVTEQRARLSPQLGQERWPVSHCSVPVEEFTTTAGEGTCIRAASTCTFPTPFPLSSSALLPVRPNSPVPAVQSACRRRLGSAYCFFLPTTDPPLALQYLADMHRQPIISTDTRHTHTHTHSPVRPEHVSALPSR